MEIDSELLLKCFRYVFYFAGSFFLFSSCEKSTSPVLSGQVRLTAEEVGVTEVWLRVKTEYISGEFSLQLWRDDSCIFQSVLNRADTTVYDSALMPAHRYRYRASVERSGHPVLESALLEITTMDTTSHDFSWEITEFPSPFGSGALYDVAIINENDIWAVGEIYSDSAQPWLPYNAVHWDGEKWGLKRITLKFRNSFITPPGEGIYAFAENDLWVTLGGAPAHWNGQSWKLYHLWDMGILEPDDGGVTCIWGSSPDNIYFAGRGGTIAHYDGQRWQRIESGTDLNFRDIWGVYDRMVNKYEILALASTVTVNIQESRIFKIRNDQVEELDNEGLSPEVSSLWFIPNKRYYIVGAGIHQKRNLHDIKWRVYSPGIVTRFLSAGVRGSNINNVIVVGSFGEIVHFNGISWYNYYPQISLSSGVFGEVSVKNNIIVAVGFNSKGFGSYAVILIGRK